MDSNGIVLAEEGVVLPVGALVRACILPPGAAEDPSAPSSATAAPPLPSLLEPLALVRPLDNAHWRSFAVLSVASFMVFSVTISSSSWPLNCSSISSMFSSLPGIT